MSLNIHAHQDKKFAMSNTPTLQQLQRGLAISEQIASLEAEMAALFNGSMPVSAAATKSTSPKSDARTGKRPPKTIAKMKAAQQASGVKIKISPLDTLEMSTPKPAKKSGMSAAHRAKLKKAAQARWARIKAGKEASPFGNTTTAIIARMVPASASKAQATKAPAKDKPTMSPETKEKLAAAMKARWVARNGG